MKFLEEIERNFPVIKNKFLIEKTTNEKYIIKHAVHYEGTKQIKLSILKSNGLHEEKLISEKDFPKYITSLKDCNKKE
jgi:hypothetical protein